MTEPWGSWGLLQCVRTIRERGLTLRHPIEIAAFANEEGSRIGHGTQGSRSFVHGLAEGEVTSLVETLRVAGISGESRRLKDGELACYLELHIEQGGVLDAAGEDIGVVTGIVGIRSFIARFHGLANHAGTTPMDMRKDALLAAARFILDVPEFVAAFGSGSSVGTCGRISVLPGGQNVIPGEAEVSVEVAGFGQRRVSQVDIKQAGSARMPGSGARSSGDGVAVVGDTGGSP